MKDNEKESVSKERKIQFKVAGMDCPDCAVTVEKGVRATPKVSDARVDFVSGMLTVAGRDLDEAKIREVVKSLGYSAEMGSEKDPQTTLLLVTDMDCADEERIVRKALTSLHSVKEFRINQIKREV